MPRNLTDGDRRKCANFGSRSLAIAPIAGYPSATLPAGGVLDASAAALRLVTGATGTHEAAAHAT